MRRPTYRVVMVDQAGGQPAELARAKVRHITWELNSWGEAVYRLPTLDPQAADATALLRREVQIWRDGVLIFWGIPVAYRATQHTVEFTAFGLLWYFARRYFGPVYSNTITPLVTNGTFEAATVDSGWSKSVPAPTIAASPLHRYTGSQSIKLTGGGSASSMYYIYQFITLPGPARSQPLPLTLSAWCYPEGITSYSPEDRGIEIQLDMGAVPPQQWALLNAQVPQNRWNRLETTLIVPAGNNDAVTIALFAPSAGSVYYDQVRFTYEQKTGAIEGEDWVDDYLRRIFNYAAGITGGGAAGPGGSPTSQDAWWGSPVLKSNLGMTFLPSNLAAGSLPADMAWNHEDRGNMYEAMLEVVKRDKSDFEVTWNASGTTRNLTPFVPRKGAYKPALAFELGRNITKFSYDVDGRQSANDVTVIGRNSGNTKEVGQAGGPTPTTLDGVQYELVESPPHEVDGQGLIDTAVSDERRLRAPVEMPTLTVRAAGLLDTTNVGGPLTTGDSVPVRVDFGMIQENAQRRVVRMTLRPPAEEVDVVTNVVA